MIVDVSTSVTLLGAGQVTQAELAETLTLAPILVAADGAAGLALRAGHVPDAVIGDMDSLEPDVMARIPLGRRHRVAEQDSTDFEKCLREIAAPLILGIGFSGRRLDHELAALNALVRHAARTCILIGPVDLCFHAPPRLSLDLTPGTRVSLFPLARVMGRGTGLRWPVDGLTLAPDGRVATSNEATGPVTLEFASPGMLVILPKTALPAAMAALRPRHPDASGSPT